MPTGYTSYICDGKIDCGTDFIMICARAFGALVEMRDNPLDAIIPEEFKPSNYHKEQIEKHKQQFERYSNMTIEEAEMLVEEEYKEELKRKSDYAIDKQSQKRKYIKVLNEVKNWEPPTKDHVELKKFAIEQIETSIEWDCYIYEEQIIKKSAEEFINNRVQEAIENMAYHAKDWQKEIEIVKNRNLWIKQLRDSLKE